MNMQQRERDQLNTALRERKLSSNPEKDVLWEPTTAPGTSTLRAYYQGTLLALVLAVHVGADVSLRRIQSPFC